MATGARRDTLKENLWRRLVRRQASSGLSVRAWCRRRGVHEAAFYWWRRELARRDAQVVRRRVSPLATPESPLSPAEGGFVPVRLARDEPAKSDPVMEILLDKGRRIRLWASVERSVLAEVLAVLEGSGC
jgi:hypothetical protein